MGSYTECACNGCPECIGCGRRHQYYTIWECDKCGDEWSDGKEMFVGLNNEELCWECYKGQFETMYLEFGDETICAHCGADDEVLFLVDGEWICEDCLYKMAERVVD